MLALALAVYVATIVLANVLTDRLGLVPVGFGLVVTAGTFAAGLALIARDWVQQSTPRRWVVLAAIVAGAALSYVLASPALAVASALAFAVSELVDLGVFTRVRGRSLALAVLLSSLVAAPVDTVLFLVVAGFPLTWSAVAGQFLVKTALAGIVAVVIASQQREGVPA